MEWYADSGGQWTWIGFEISMGERTGEYVWFTGGHTYADFDQPDVDPQANAESVDEKIAPHVSDVRVALSRVRPEVSMIVADAGLRPLYEVITFGLNPGGGPAFMHFLGKLKEAFETTGAAVEYTVREVTQGATGAQWTVVLPHESFASMELAPDLLETLMEQVHGGFESDALVEMFNSAVSSVTSEVYVTRPDLSVNLPSPTD